MKKSCCFIGHRKIKRTDVLDKKIFNIVDHMIKEYDIDIFYFGSRSDFNDLCYEIVSELKKTHPDIKRVYIRAEFPYISENYKKYLLENYEETHFPDCALNAGRLRYVIRNKKMIELSDFCFFYYNERYLSPKEKYSKNDLTNYQPKSGTKMSYDYAKKLKKRIYNFYADEKNKY